MDHPLIVSEFTGRKGVLEVSTVVVKTQSIKFGQGEGVKDN